MQKKKTRVTSIFVQGLYFKFYDITTDTK